MELGDASEGFAFLAWNSLQMHDETTELRFFYPADKFGTMQPSDII